jgi:mono/diheme cytochrome c family protein
MIRKHAGSIGALLIFIACAPLACGRGDRNTATADSAVVQARAQRDSSVYTVPPPPDSSGNATISAISFPHPATIIAADSIAGQRLYRRDGSCIPCHGSRAEGVAGLGSRISDDEWLQGDGSLAFLYRTIHDGLVDPGAARSSMPGKGQQLSRQQIFQIAAYVYTLSHAGSTVQDSTALPAGAPPIARPPADTAHRTDR